MIPIILVIFVLGYAAVAFENFLKINKAASALISGVLIWSVFILMSDNPRLVSEQLTEYMGELSGILFFLLGAMAIVELIDAHDGFDLITDRIRFTKKKRLLWVISFITFFLSSILDNLTTTIVMVSLLRKLINDPKDRLFFSGMIVIAANAGGAWSPIGDVTTTMLWIGGQISATKIIIELFFPSLVCLGVPLLVISRSLKGNIERPAKPSKEKDPLTDRHKLIVLISGIMVFILVPVFKTITQLPAFMGIILGLGLLWLITEIMHGGKDEEDKNFLSVTYALRKIDAPSILFFLGILISISALQSIGLLAQLANWTTSNISNNNILILSIGLLSSIIDNVPLVSATQGMYPLSIYPMDNPFWEFLAYATGTGGSILIIGSASGIAAMGMEKISFGWYLKKISWLAVLGYFAGAAAFLIQQDLFL